MLVALNENNERILPKKGLAGYCQQCGEPVKAYCGEIIIHHWKHQVDRNCDPWKEHESEWHRAWKNKFPFDWQEVVLEHSGQKHIADIKTPARLVLELQNSPISTTVIREREEFYGNICWLVNAIEFKANFKVSSLVGMYLADLDRQHSRPYSCPSTESAVVDELRVKLAETRAEIHNVEYQMQRHDTSLVKIAEFEKDIDLAISNYLKPSSIFQSDLQSFQWAEKETLSGCRASLESLRADLENRRRQLEILEGFPSCGVHGYEHWKLVDADHVSTANFSKCLLIEKSTQNSLFPEVTRFRSEREFDQMAKNRNHILVIDPTDFIKRINVSIADLESQIASLKSSEQQLLISLKRGLTDHLAYIKEKKTLSIADARTKFAMANRLCTDLELKIEAQISLEEQERTEEQIELAQEHKRERTAVMRRYKGRYRYRWNYRRKTWDVATGRVFLDFQDHIFEIVNDSVLRKLGEGEFINLIKNGQPTDNQNAY